MKGVRGRGVKVMQGVGGRGDKRVRG